MAVDMRINDNQAVTLIVAASDSLHPERADYVCGGADDQVQIQAAIDALPTGGGNVVILGGKYYISGIINLNKTYAGLVGENPYASWISLENNADCDMLRIGSDSSHQMFNRVNNLSLHGNSANNAGTINGITVLGNKISDMQIDRIIVMDPRYRGISIQTDSNTAIRTPPSMTYWNFWISNSLFEYCQEGAGIDIRPHAAGRHLGQMWIENNYIISNWQGVIVDGSQETLPYLNIHNNLIGRNDRYGCVLNNVINSTVSGMNIYDNNYSGNASSGSTGLKIDNCSNISILGGYSKSILNTAPELQYYNLWLTGTSDNIRVLGMDVGGNVQVANVLDDSSGDNYIRDNIGFVTEKSGTATLVSGTTSIAVTHGLAVTPAAGDIVVTPIEAWGNMTQFYIDTYTSTQFTIHADINPGQDVDFAWKAIVL